MRYPTYEVFVTAFLALALTIVLAPVWIAFLRTKNIGEEIREDGPSAHQAKRGTPTMGGILIMLCFLLPFLLRTKIDISSPSLIAVFATIALGILGFIDDYSKSSQTRSLGIKARWKLFWQFAIAIAIAYLAQQFGHLETDVSIPLTDRVIPLGPLYYLLVISIVVSASNGVNLADGLDGIAAGTAAVVIMAFAGIAFRQDHLDLAIFCAAVAGSCIGFLWHNSYPAEIFMGNTGSLALGGAIAAAAIMTKTELLLILIGGIYVIETVSVIAQIVSYRYFKRRVLKMAPIHHHFELLGWSETKIMIRFWIVSGICAASGFAVYFMDVVRGLR